MTDKEKIQEKYLDDLRERMVSHPFINALDNYIDIRIAGSNKHGSYATIDETNEARTNLIDELTKLIKEEQDG